MEIVNKDGRHDEPTAQRYVTPLDMWCQLPEWKREWFEGLSHRDLEMIFPSDSNDLEQWLHDRRWTRTVRKFLNRVGRTGMTAIVGAVSLAALSALWIGFQVLVGKH